MQDRDVGEALWENKLGFALEAVVWGENSGVQGQILSRGQCGTWPWWGWGWEQGSWTWVLVGGYQGIETPLNVALGGASPKQPSKRCANILLERRPLGSAVQELWRCRGEAGGAVVALMLTDKHRYKLLAHKTRVLDELPMWIPAIFCRVLVLRSFLGKPVAEWEITYGCLLLLWGLGCTDLCTTVHIYRVWLWQVAGVGNAAH